MELDQFSTYYLSVLMYNGDPDKPDQVIPVDLAVGPNDILNKLKDYTPINSQDTVKATDWSVATVMLPSSWELLSEDDDYSTERVGIYFQSYGVGAVAWIAQIDNICLSVDIKTCIDEIAKKKKESLGCIE